jgi:acetamidase/formamidase
MIATVAALQMTAGGAAETHRFVPKVFHNTFSSAHAPVLRIKPGHRVITTTIDAHGFDSHNNKVGEAPNPQTGPFYIEGAEPGDVLVVRLEKIEPNRRTAWSGSLLAPYTVDPRADHGDLDDR